MKQYCRYCYSAIEGDVYYCTAYHKILSNSMLKKVNRCPDYEYCGIDVITSKEHIERKIKHKLNNGSEQIHMDEINE